MSTCHKSNHDGVARPSFSLSATILRNSGGLELAERSNGDTVDEKPMAGNKAWRRVK